MQPPISQNISHVWSHVDFTRLACLKESVNVDNKCHFLKFWVCLIFSYSWNICISKLVYPSFMHIIISQWRFSQIFFQLPNNNERVKQYEQKWAETPLMQNYGPPGGFFMHDFFSLAGKLQRSITWPDFFSRPKTKAGFDNFRTLVHYRTLLYTIVWCTTVHYCTVYTLVNYGTLQYTMVHYGTLQHTMVH